MSVDLALGWALEGHRVLPVSPPPSKRPLIKAWQDACTDNQTEIHAWWYHHPDARVGIATGKPGFDVLDFDVANGKPGMEQLEKLMDLGILIAGTFRVVSTPSGGRHLYFQGTEQRNKQNEKSIPGVDFRGQGGMVLAAGNDGYRYINGASLGWEDLAVVDWDKIRAALAPDAVAPTTPLPFPPRNQTAPGGAYIPQPPPASPVGSRGPNRVVAPKRAFDDPIGEESPLDWYTRNHQAHDLLIGAGWQFAGENGGRRHYRRPGKDTDVSGNLHTMPDGREVFYNFSSSVDLPTDTALSTAQLYAHLEHGGNLGAAAGHVRRSLMPQRGVYLDARTPPAGPPVNLLASAGMQMGAAATETTEDTPGAELGDRAIPSSELVPISAATHPKMVVEFWDRRPLLADIRWFARERRVSPWATLGAVLALASCRIGPHVHLPPIVGGKASLNLLVGLVGPSGKGKGAATATATEFLGVEGRFMSEEVGTSQGIDASFTEAPAKGGPVQFNDVAFFYVPEIDTIKAHAEMSGSALLPTLRKMWSGEPLGAKYAGKERRRPVRGHAYRASVVAGIQPKRSGILLDDVDGGTPQRWLWLPVADPGALRRTDRVKPPLYWKKPPQLDYDVWIPQGEQRGEKDEPLPIDSKAPWEIPVCRKAQNDIIDARELNLLSDEATMDSHGLLTRLKVAALLCFLDMRLDTGVTEDDWDLALAIMWISNHTRQVCVRAREEAEDEEHTRRGRGRAAQSMAEQMAAPVLRDQRIEKISHYGQRALAKLQETAGREFSPRELLKAFMDASSISKYGADILVAVIATPGVTEGPEISSGGRKIRKLSWQPVIGPAGRQ